MGIIVAVVHALEDAVLLSLGRFLPVPIWAMYCIGIIISGTILTVVINRFTDRFQKRLTGE